MPLRISLRLALAVLPVLLIAAPASAELKVRVSRPETGRFESVGITVTDPIGGLDAKPGPLTVTMADSTDHRQAIYLEPTGKAGEWSGRFTPVKTGRYTGTAVLERGDEHEIGLAPLIRVRPSARPGFLQLHPYSRRALKYSRDGAFFPVGVRLSAEDVRAPGWSAEFRKLRRSGVNYFEVPVEWPDSLSDADRAAAEKAIDAMLVDAEQAGHAAIQLRLEGPPQSDDTGAYEQQLQRWVRRWSYSPALAVWHVAGATDSVSADACARLVQAIRRADTYDHLVGLPTSGRVRGGADLPIVPFQLQRPVNRFAIVEMPDSEQGPPPLPGENSWQLLAVGGIGLPLYPYHVYPYHVDPSHAGADDNGAFLQRLARLAGAARSIPFHAAIQTPTGLVPADTPASFGRYGNTVVGWLAPEGDRVLDLANLPRGKYRALFWDPSTDTPIGRDVRWSTGRSLRLELPKKQQTVFFEVLPLGGGQRPARPSAPVVRSAPRPRPRPVRTVARPRPARKTAAQLRADRLAALRRKRAAAAAARRKPVRLTRAQMRAQKKARARAAAAAKKKPAKKLTKAQLRARKKARAHAGAAMRTKKTRAAQAKSKSKKSAKKAAPAKKVKKAAAPAKKKKRRW